MIKLALNEGRRAANSLEKHSKCLRVKRRKLREVWVWSKPFSQSKRQVVIDCLIYTEILTKIAKLAECPMQMSPA